MKKFIISAFFTIKAETVEDAEVIAGEMQQTANNVYRDIDKYLIIDETEPIVESEVGMVVKEYLN